MNGRTHETGHNPVNDRTIDPKIRTDKTDKSKDKLPKYRPSQNNVHTKTKTEWTAKAVLVLYDISIAVMAGERRTVENFLGRTKETDRHIN